MLSAIVNNFCTLTNLNGMQWDVLSPDAIVKIMNMIQPIRGQESLYKLYKTISSLPHEDTQPSYSYTVNICKKKMLHY